ncbi:hypothetical protein Agabi119p4_6570 [Agaricus bisporus var. burnettii]|uniref:Uncharacterized protein n=1 Tax=Agaricus bisporus var. burnettii TaxID=192524 RepID=A0A8H7CAM6_AGABI|nr:hypothetical protein Agabi119p4_6570 [Agaricus bisporus var. burnettii]
MAKNHITITSNQQTPAMSPARTHTVGPATNGYLHDDDDDDICPVCDTECTCNNNRTRVVQQPVSLNQYSLQFDGSSSSTISSASHSLPKPSPHPLKIKLTVPPKFLGNTKSTSASDKSKNNQQMTSAFARVGESSRNITPSVTHSRLSSKRRGRPPKIGVVAARQAVKARPATSRKSTSPPPYLSRPFISKSTVGRKRAKNSGSVQKRPLKARHAGSRPPLKRKQRARSNDDDESSLSALTDVDYDCDNDDDGESVVFPTFVSASVLSSLESGNSSDSSEESSNSESLSFVTDSDVEEEEENFIMSEVHEKARLRRELLGDDDHRRDSQGEWVIRSRKKSVGSDDSGMAVDSAATEDEDEDEDEEPEDEEEETDGKPVGTGYAGLVTAWSDDDESSFDADIFFANLAGSGSDSDSSCSLENQDGVDGDHSDMETNSLNDASELLSRRQELENLQLDVTQGWDGEIVFTNGINDGRGILDIDFEVNASQFMAEDSPEHTQDSDVDMSPCNSIGAADGEGYEEDDNAADGDTTDEDLVGEDDLPNEQAMKLFSLPFSVSAIDPLSTVSPIASPTYRRVPPGRRGLGSPKPEDILAGKISWDSDDHDYDEVEVRKGRRGSQSSGVRGPRPGLFVPVQETRKAIIDGTNQAPSPHPRFNRSRYRSTTGRINSVEQMLRRHLLNGSGSAPTFSTASELLSPLQVLSSDNDFGSPSPSMPMSVLPEERGSLAQSINIDDVLEASYLGADSSEASDNSITKRKSSNAAEDDNLSSARHMQSLNRWDLISVGAFKQTRENGGWSSDNLPHTPHSSMDYNSIMKPSPLSSIMWPKEKEKVRKGRKGKEPIPISPVILAVRDGDRSPSGSGNRQQNETLNKHMQHRKESKRERKLKKKNWGPVHHQHAHHNHYHQHQHHPNTKMRGSVANQRSSLSSVPPFSL